MNMTCFSRFVLASVSLVALVAAGCAGQLDDESQFLDASVARGGGSGSGGAAGTGGSSGMGGTAGSGPGCDYMTILTTSCAAIGCHGGATAQAGIHLDDPASIAGLVGMKAPAGACSAANDVLVVNPTNPTDSLLYVVLQDPLPSGYCGIRMPFGGNQLPTAQRDCMLAWIRSLPGVMSGD
jgi:hypothetical protein